MPFDVPTTPEPDSIAADNRSSIPRRRTIIAAGCLGMAYSQLTLSPASVDFIRELGGDSLHVGVFGAIPFLMLALQFVAAALINYLPSRKAPWIVLSLIYRVALVPAALGPLLYPDTSVGVWLFVFLAISSLSHALMNLASPLWMSWMGDYLPRRGLNQFWGERHLWMQWAGAAALMWAASCISNQEDNVPTVFALFMVVAAILGVIDVLMFIVVSEPPIPRTQQARIRLLLCEPFQNVEFRSFVLFTAIWNFAVMTGAPFIGVYLLGSVGMTLQQVLLLWAFCWVGGALFSGMIGRLADRIGHRPILTVCALLKSSNMLALILVPHEPKLAFIALVPVFTIDSILNSGIVVATNGYLFLRSPAQNRAMYIAAGTAVAGMAGGIASVAMGTFISASLLQGVGGTANWDPYHVAFLISIVLRLLSVPFALRVSEPPATGHSGFLGALIGMAPMQMLRYPVGLLRRETELLPEESGAALSGDTSVAD